MNRRGATVAREDLVRVTGNAMYEQVEELRLELSNSLWAAGVLDNEDVSRAIAAFVVKTIGVYQKTWNGALIGAESIER